MLSISPVIHLYDSTYESLLGSILPGTQWVTAPIVVPYTENTLTPFVLNASVGDIVKIYVNDKLIKAVTALSTKFPVDLQLNLGKNYIFLQSATETYYTLIAATYYSIYLDAWSEDFYYHLLTRVDDAQRQLDSPLSLRSVEHQLEFQHLLPSVRTVRTLAGKLGVRSMICEAPSTRGVFDLATAITGSTPVVVPTRVDLQWFEPSVYGMYTTPQDAHGSEFDVWVPNSCVTSWAAFTTLVNNLSHITILGASDRKITLQIGGSTEQHVFDFDLTSCDILNNLTSYHGCFESVTLFVSSIRSHIRKAFCAYHFPFELAVEIPLLIGALDNGAELDLGNDLDSFDDDGADPYGNGFFGAVITPPLDSGLYLDAEEEEAKLHAMACEDMVCQFTDPLATILAASLCETNISLDEEMFATCDSDSLVLVVSEGSVYVSDNTQVSLNNIISETITDIIDIPNGIIVEMTYGRTVVGDTSIAINDGYSFVFNQHFSFDDVNVTTDEVLFEVFQDKVFNDYVFIPPVAYPPLFPVAGELVEVTVRYSRTEEDVNTATDQINRSTYVVRSIDDTPITAIDLVTPSADYNTVLEETPNLVVTELIDVGNYKFVTDEEVVTDDVKAALIYGKIESDTAATLDQIGFVRSMISLQVINDVPVILITEVTPEANQARLFEDTAAADSDSVTPRKYALFDTTISDNRSIDLLDTSSWSLYQP